MRLCAATVTLTLVLMVLADTVTSLTDRCPEWGWSFVPTDSTNITSEGMCYQWFGGAFTWEQASQKCRNETGELPSIKCSAAYSRIKTYILSYPNHRGPQQYWYLNGKDDKHEGRWRWIDDNSLFTKYDTHWNTATGQPEISKYRNCAALKVEDGTWIDEWCNRNKSYILCTKTAAPAVCEDTWSWCLDQFERYYEQWPAPCTADTDDGALMRLHCQKTCGLCGPPMTITTTTPTTPAPGPYDRCLRNCGMRMWEYEDYNDECMTSCAPPCQTGCKGLTIGRYDKRKCWCGAPGVNFDDQPWPPMN